MVSLSIIEIWNWLSVKEIFLFKISINKFNSFRDHALLLSHISCASSSLKDSDIDRIEPLLVTFCSLYSVSLVPLHDDEFFHGPPDTAFRTSEIADMVKILRDVCMGIVRFMYPDKQISNQSTNTNDNDESITKTNRIQKQVAVARQRASKFSMVFKVKKEMIYI